MSKRRNKQVVSALIVLAAAVVGLAQQQGWISSAGSTVSKGVTTSQPGMYTIDHFVDGDTIVVNMNGSVETIRFIGIDTPETHKPNTPVQCYGPEAAAHTKDVISKFGKVRLQADPMDTNRDRYGRLLRYVYLPDGTLLDE